METSASPASQRHSLRLSTRKTNDAATTTLPDSGQDQLGLQRPSQRRQGLFEALGMSDFPSGWFYIKSALNEKCLQPLSGSYEPTRIVVSSQIFGDDAGPQLWTHENGYIVNKQSHLCLDYEHGNFKRLGDINTCQWHRKVGKDAHNQKWLHRTGGLIACNDDINRVLDLKPTGTHDGAEVFLRKMEIQDDSHPANQRWTLEVQMEESQAEPGMISEQPRGAAPSTSWRRAGADDELRPEATENPWANDGRAD